MRRSDVDSFKIVHLRASGKLALYGYTNHVCVMLYLVNKKQSDLPVRHMNRNNLIYRYGI